MGELFTDNWMKQLMSRWNSTEDIVAPLHEAGFSSRIAYGFKGESQPRGILVIESGLVVQAGSYDGGEVDWDLRASPESWKNWMDNGFGLAKLGPAVATRALEFAQGNYRQMIRNPSLSHPFLQHFKLMSGIA